MPKYTVWIDCDRKGGDDDVFTYRTTVEAENVEAAEKAGEANAIKKYGVDNVLGAFDVRLEA